MNSPANTAADTARADTAVKRLHELIALAHDAVQDVYNATPATDERFVPVDMVLGDLEARVREMRGNVYVSNDRVPALRRALRNV